MNRAPPTSRPSSSSFPSPPFGERVKVRGLCARPVTGLCAPAPSPGPKAGRPLPAGARRGTSKKIATPLVTAILLFLLCLTPHLAHALSVVQTVSCTDQSTCTITGVAAGDMLLFGADLEQHPRLSLLATPRGIHGRMIVQPPIMASKVCPTTTMARLPTFFGIKVRPPVLTP